MQIIATHNNADFDGLASMVAATFLYPGAVAVLPVQLQRNVDEFVALHRDLFRVCSAKDLDLADVTSLVVVDTNQWSRLERLAVLRERPDFKVHLWDHHMIPGDIEPTWRCHEESGAAVTLLLREMKRRDTAFTPIHATLFLTALYDDTGSLSYPSTTPEDAHTAGFLLENGADLNIANAFLATSFDSGHTEVLTKMLEGAEIMSLAGARVGIFQSQVDSALGMLSSVVDRYLEIKGLEAAFGIFDTGRGRCMVIGRAGHYGVNVGALMRRLGGGGHPGAGSAFVKSKAPDTVRSELCLWVTEEMKRPRIYIGEIMSDCTSSIAEDTTVAQARALMEKGLLPALVVARDDKLCGIISRSDCAKAKTDAQLNAPVKAFMKREVPLLGPRQSLREALRIMAAFDPGVLPVLEDDRIIGLVSRTDLMLHLYEF